MWHARALMPFSCVLAVIAHSTLAGAQATPATDSLRAVALAQLLEARMAARGVSDSAERERIWLAVLSEQVELSDHRAAGATAHTIGHDRTNAFRRAVCGCIREKQFDAALEIARSVPAADERAWMVALVAAQRARPDLAQGDTAGALRQAVEIARAVNQLLPRADALLMVASRQLAARDTVGAVSTVESARLALDALGSTDERIQRLPFLAGLYARNGRLDRAVRLLSELRALEDRRTALQFIANDPTARGDASLREAGTRLLADAERISDPRARRFFRSQTGYILRTLGDTAAARAAGTRDRFEFDAPASLGDSAESLALHGEIERAITLVERIADPERLGLKAKAYQRVAWSISISRGPERALQLLRLGRAAALSEAGPDVRDRRLAAIAKIQFWLTDNDGAVETLASVLDPQEIILAAGDLAMSTRNRADYGEQLRIASRLGHPEARAAVVAQTIERHIQGDASRRALDLSVERVRAELISVPAHRARALAAVSHGFFSRGDTASAVALWRSVLATTAPSPAPNLRAFFLASRSGLLSVVNGLVSVGETGTIRQWIAAQSTPAQRAWAHFYYAWVLRVNHDVATRRGYWINNGPDPCLEEF